MSIFNSNTTYVISQDITLTADETIPNNVTLIFQGGKILGSGKTLTGNHTKIVAPIEQIIGNGVIVKGTWDTKNVFIEWFGTTIYDDLVDYSDTSLNVQDAGLAINNAINMKGRGKVFLPKGVYVIKEPIIVKDGIQLIGERGMEAYPQNDYQGTILQTWKTSTDDSITDGSNKYIIYVNCDKNRVIITQGGFLAGQITSIRDIELYNYIPGGTYSSASTLQSSTTACMRGIFALENFVLDHVRFYNFRNALTYSSDRYMDSKTVTNCDYVCINDNYSLLDKLFAYDFGFLGDDLMFEHNTIHDGKNNKGLRLHDCYGGTIRCNIIHADIELNSCKAITFSNNHMEFGPVITINSSNVNMNSNYIERAYRVPVVIKGTDSRDKSVVKMKNDLFAFVETPRSYFEGNEGSESNPSYQVFHNRLVNASEYDISIDNNAVLSLEQVYRHRVCKISGKIYPNGIKICKESDGSSFDEFNDFSYMLSQNGLISSDYNVDKSFTIKNLNNINVHTAMLNDDVYWLADSGNYMYKYQVIYDKERPLLATRNNSQLFSVNNSTDMGNGLVQNTLTGVLLVIADNNGDSARATIRLFRKKGTNWNTGTDFMYVDIPNNNNHFFYDNGISINGFHWIGATASNILLGATGLESITFQGDNVVCRMTGTNNGSTWKSGDVLALLGNPSRLVII